MSIKKRTIVAFLLGLLAQASFLAADTKIVLTDSFIKEYKHRATISTCFFVEFAHDKPKHPSPSKPSNDGDIHIAGHADAVGLATVGELMNAKSEPEAVQLANEAEGGECLTMMGAWRIWTEHGGDQIHSQLEPVPPASNTNPDHVFEIHPVVRLGDIDMPNSLRPIPDYEPKEAYEAFTKYESTSCKIQHDDLNDITTITTRQAGYNYPEFVMEIIDEEPFVVPDGRFMFASIYDLGGELIVRKARTVFIKDTRPELIVRTLGKGARLHVLGIPRVNLALVSWRVRKDAEQHDNDPSNDDPLYADVLNWSLPYEIIIVGVYDE